MIYKILIKVLFLLITITMVSTTSLAAYVKPPINKQGRTAELETIYDAKKLAGVRVDPNQYLIWVDLTKQRMSIFQNKEFVTSYQVLTGADKSLTPTGTFRINAKIFRANDNYNLYNNKKEIVAKVSYWIPFIGNMYAFHNASWREFPEFGNTKRRPLGGSHGCINMSYADVEDFYNNYASRKATVFISRDPIVVVRPK
jgi:lipoprotein-anchoring transpeptidase ErfK/SrfK